MADSTPSPGTSPAAGAAALPGTTAGAPPQEAPPMRRSKLLRWILLLTVPVIVGVVAAYIYLNSGRIAETDNAYIKAGTVPISSVIAGTITEMSVEENQRVKAGDILFRIDDETYRLDRDRAAAQLETVKAAIGGLQASYRQTEKQLELARNNVSYTERELKREQGLAERGLGSDSDLDDAQHELDTARLQIPILEQSLERLRAQLGGPHSTIEEHAGYRTAKAALERAEVELERTVVRSPFDGIVTQIIPPGAYATPGRAMMMLVSDTFIYVEANFKETELTHVEVGQPVTIRVDTYKGEEWHGEVESISPATGAEFSVIPAQNASGNWVKIAQRIPVRIRLDDPTGGSRLRGGMSAIVEIDTGFEREAPRFLSFLQR
jgi:membrane fusion protein (multidrug efflux system)